MASIVHTRPQLQLAAPAITPPLPIDVGKLEAAVVAFFKELNVPPQFTDRDTSNLVVTAAGLRNRVVKGENFWEKISFYITMVIDETFNASSLFIVSDGYFTASLVNPPITSYTNSFEPQYYKYLDDFNKYFGNFLQEHLHI